MTAKILYQGQFYDPSGYAVAARGYVKSIHDYITHNNLDIDLKIVPISADKLKSLTNEEKEFLDPLAFDSVEDMDKWIADEDYHYVFHHPPVYAWKLPITKKLAALSVNTTCITVWETDRMPSYWGDIFEMYSVDKIVVPCKWNQQNFVASLESLDTPLPVIAVPHLINENFIKDDAPSKNDNFNILNQDSFNVLTVGQWTDRKALLNVIKAFLMEFKGQEDCSLFVKTYGNIQNSNPEYQKHQQQQIAHQIGILKNSILGDDMGIHGPPPLPKCKLHLLYGLYPKSRMNYLYKNADLFALFSKAEGFGLPIAEAIVNQTPVIVHDKGGHVDYLDKENNFLVECYSTPANCTIFPFVYSCDSNWFETDFLSARKQFRLAYQEWKDNKDSYSKRGPAVQKYMLDITGDSVALGEMLVNFVREANASSN